MLVPPHWTTRYNIQADSNKLTFPTQETNAMVFIRILLYDATDHEAVQFEVFTVLYLRVPSFWDDNVLLGNWLMKF